MPAREGAARCVPLENSTCLAEKNSQQFVGLLIDRWRCTRLQFSIFKFKYDSKNNSATFLAKLLKNMKTYIKNYTYDVTVHILKQKYIK